MVKHFSKCLFRPLSSILLCVHASISIPTMVSLGPTTQSKPKGLATHGNALNHRPAHPPFSPQAQTFLGGLVTGGLQISIRLSGTPDTHPGEVFPLVRGRPGWKVRKSVFAALRDAHVAPKPTIAPTGPSDQRPPYQPQSAHSPPPPLPLVYSSWHDTEGEVTLSLPRGKSMDHLGVQVKFVGRIDLVSRCECVVLFLSLGIERMTRAHFCEPTGGWAPRGPASLRLRVAFQRTAPSRDALRRPNHSLQLSRRGEDPRGEPCFARRRREKCRRWRTGDAQRNKRMIKSADRT